jgi:hypothetical protein
MRLIVNIDSIRHYIDFLNNVLSSLRVVYTVIYEGIFVLNISVFEFLR